jgi:hypothetical protein
MKTSYQVLAAVVVGATVILTAMAHIGGSRPATAPSRMGSAVDRSGSLATGKDDSWRIFAALPCETCIPRGDFTGVVASASLGADEPVVASDDPFASDLRAAPDEDAGALASPAPQITAGAMMAFGAALAFGGRRRSGISAWTAPWRAVDPDA